ncbi:carbohydrate kinase [Rhodobacteraceae bacterium CCMM004]|nr:carbohydrate kinase [Rhodobacteraceae bacterium CCMM004]
MSRVAVIDIGKTNAKLALVDTTGPAEIAVHTRPNRVLDAGPYPHVDVDGIWSFVLDALSHLEAEGGVDAVSVTTHGASGALLTADGGLACPILDYEHDGPDRSAAAYDALRPGFAETGSPRLPGGLNLGAQVHWLLETQPGLDARVAQVITYPQVWSGRLTGRFGCDHTSLGCHTDLWAPWEGRYSTLVAALGLERRMPVPTPAGTVVGTVLPAVARRTGMRPETPVISGIHDSNASLLPHLLAREAPFAVVSTGTWVVSLAVGGRRGPLDPGRDTLVNVDARGAPTPSARFMGGRDRDTLAGETAAPTRTDVARVLKGGLCLWPSVVPGTGPFPQRRGGWSDPGAAPGEKGAALSFYLAMMTAECLALIGADGPSVIEGPFAADPLYAAMLGTATGRPVVAAPRSTGTSIGAALLAVPDAPPPVPAKALSPPPEEKAVAMAAYAARWREGVG